MESQSRALLERLLMAPSPSGHEQPIQHFIHERVKGFADTIEPDLHGNLIIGLNTGAKRRVMLAGL